MNIITAIPVARGIGKDFLSYFTAENIPLGSLIKVPLRNRTVHALVLASRKASDIKAEIRGAHFEIKKIGSISGKQFIPESFLKAVCTLAEYYGTSLGSVLYTLLPQTILNKAEKLLPLRAGEVHHKSLEKLMLQASDENRLSTYKSLVREEFAKKSSIYICVPTIEEALYLGEELKKGLDAYTCVLGSFLSPQKLVTTWNKLADEKHPVLIVGTPQFLSVPREDIGLIVIEKENSHFYKTITRPFMDMRKAIEEIATLRKSKLIFADALVSVETMWRFEQGEITELADPQMRIVKKAEIILVDRRKDKDKVLSDKQKEELSLALGKEALSLIEHTQKNNGHLFILCGRKGLYPSTFCGDCGTQVVCKKCATPVVLHERKNGRVFLCHSCGTARSTEETCTHCNSWKLNTYGIGIERVVKEIKTSFPQVKISQIDSNTTKTRQKITETVAHFYEKPGGILVGTDLALNYLHMPVENIIISSIDNLFAIPDYKINERILKTLTHTASLATSYLLIQTRNSKHPIFGNLMSGNLGDFYREEIEERKKWNYPPFSIFVKVSLIGEKNITKNLLEELKKSITNYECHVFTSPFLDMRGKSITHLLIRIPREKWPDTQIVEILKGLSPEYVIRVNPENLL